MIEADKRKAIVLLHQEGMSVRQIARRLGVARNSVREIIAQRGEVPQANRKDKQVIDPELLRTLHEQCEGRVQRVYEKLTEEEGIEVTYSTLSRMLRELGIGKPQKTRCHRVPDEPGAEMQHDTTVYQVQLGGQTGPGGGLIALPALQQTALPEVLSCLQPVQDEVLLP